MVAALTQEQLIWQLNRVILGWATYHRHIVATRTYRKVDLVIWHCLWRWAKRRHTNQSSFWVLKRYWHPVGGRRWHFAAGTGERAADGTPVWKALVCANQTNIRRHLKIRGAANPYDPSWRQYFEERAISRRTRPTLS